ncbi:MAG: M48 family metallopeptidase [Gammaproteobacteria bacterium]|nr:M48 family metallopeptidase [Gammaproteobacteria bacterium]
MDFFARQEQSRRTTRILVGLFLLAVAATVTAVTIAAAVFIGMYRNPYGAGQSSGVSPIDWLTANANELLLIAGLTAAFIGLASLYRVVSLSSGGGQVARLLGAAEVTADTTDPLERRLVNVVEEMAIASGTPVPEVFVLQEEHGINAFAAGLTTSDAAVAVTRGALERLNRAELQGVIAHEFSHILNGDMRLNQQLMGLSFGILALAQIGRLLLRSMRVRTGRKSNGAAMMGLVIGVTLILIGSIGLFFSRLIKAGVSRQREMLADASAVQFTRDRAGLAGALKKIGGYTGTLVGRNSEEVAHMLFSRGARAFRGWFATHPPIDERILALDPSFTPGDYPDAGATIPSGEAGLDSPATQAFAPEASTPTDADFVGRAGTVAPHSVAAAIRTAIPESLDHAAHSRELSLLLALALGLSRSATTRTRQLELLEQQLGATRRAKCGSLAAELDEIDDQYRLPLLELSMPALKHRPAEQLTFVLDLLHRVTALNPDERLFDYALLRLLERYLDSTALADTPLRTRKAKRSASGAVIDLLKCVAAHGHDDAGTALDAYRAGIARVAAEARNVAEPSFSPLDDARELQSLDAALERLASLRPKQKQRVLSAVLASIRHDRRISIAELELLRVIAASLGCPMPPAIAFAPAD